MNGVFAYELPPGRIAQYPLEKREEAKLLTVVRAEGTIAETGFCSLTGFLRPGDRLVLNDVKVIPARLRGKKDTGGNVEIFLLAKQGPRTWEVLVRGGLKPGRSFSVGPVGGRLIERTPSGSYVAEFEIADDRDLFSRGEVPLPPYIKRRPDDRDKEYYQTVYARKEGAVAAPTAGLHFTGATMERLKESGVGISFVTLYLGWASFRLAGAGKAPVAGERYEVSAETAAAINGTRAGGGRIVAVGTSTVRTLESVVENGTVFSRTGTTSLYIEPGYVFRAVDALVTNFHLPGSTHLAMVCAFGGTSLMERAYRYAIDHAFRFYSYGDAMLIL